MSTDLAQHLTEFQQQGLTCFPQQLDPATVAQWQSVFQNRLADPPPNRNRRDTYQLIQKYPQLTLPFVANAQVPRLSRNLDGTLCQLRRFGYGRHLSHS